MNFERETTQAPVHGAYELLERLAEIERDARRLKVRESFSYQFYA